MCRFDMALHIAEEMGRVRAIGTVILRFFAAHISLMTDQSRFIEIENLTFLAAKVASVP